MEIKLNLPKVDKRHKYVCVLDTETTNTIDNNGKLDMTNVMFYDMGFEIRDTHGRPYGVKYSFVNSDIFVHEAELMQSAYYAKKILRYRERLGGSFVSIHQLKEIDGFTQERFQAIENRICVNEESIIKFSFWEIDDTFLKKHPYIGAYTVRGVMLFLNRNQELRGLSGKEMLDIMEKE